VLKRYLELVAGADAQASALYSLVSLDADLLSRWVTTLGCAVEPQEILRGLEDFGPESLAAMGRAQIWAVVPLGSTARLGLDQWRGVLLAACVAQALATRAGYPDGEAARLRVLLAGSGVQQPADRLMGELAEFRGVDATLLVDAHPVLRAFAVSEALERQGRAQAAAVASVLFGLDGDDFARLFAEAERQTAALIERAGVQFEGAEDWFEALWVQAQLAAFSVALGRQSDSTSLQELGRRVARGLFGHEPRLFILDQSGTVLEGTGDDDLAALRLPLATSPSIVAASLRELAAIDAEEAPAVAVTDRQLMRRLGADRIQAWPLYDGAEHIGSVVFRVQDEERADLALLMAGFVAEMGRWLGAFRAQERSLEAGLVEYRARHEKRLREIVHEANNPLSIVNNYLHILELRLKDHPETHEQIRLVGAEIRRTAAIIRKVTEFPMAAETSAPPAARSLARVDLNSVVQSVVELSRGNAAEASIEVQVVLPEEAVVITSDRDRITQVLTNLVRNAIEAMTGGGRLVLESVSGVYRAGRAGAELAVRDNGPGLPEEVLAALYAPKRSRKGGEHAGLGLHITAGLVDELEGAIDVRTTRGKGTSFSVFLPDLAS